MFKLREYSVSSCLLDSRALLIIKCMIWCDMTFFGIFRFLNWQSLQHGSTHNTSSKISPRLALDVKYGLFGDKNSKSIVETIHLNILH